MNFTKEQITKAISCKSVDELLKLAKSEGVELTREQAETYFAKLSKSELTAEELAKVAGGGVGMGLQLAGLQNPQSLDNLGNNNNSRCKCDNYIPFDPE
ncbi:MAG: DUF2624 family protein [Synergistaceae bacterium]|nr:DUF2624 family protein [Synergistaceae bacterium]